MQQASSISALPSQPAVYAMYGGRGGSRYVAYVGIAGQLKDRIVQHLVRRASSVSTGTSAVALNADYVTEVEWWQDKRFANRDALRAAELVAFDVLEPVLRSRGRVTEAAQRSYEDEAFRQEMAALFGTGASGRLVIPTLEHALKRIAKLEERVAALEQRQVPK